MKSAGDTQKSPSILILLTVGNDASQDQSTKLRYRRIPEILLSLFSTTEYADLTLVVKTRGMVKNAINLKTPASGALIALRGETHVETLSHLGVRVFVYLGVY